MSDISIKDFLNDATDLACRAVAQDKIGNCDVAKYFYTESLSLLTRAREELVKMVGSAEATHATIINERVETIDRKVMEYQKRVNELEASKVS